MKFRQRLLPGWILLSLFSTAIPVTSAVKDSVKTQSGPIAGTPGTDPSITVFKFIPYAAPPVGALRWRAPQPPSPWQGIRKSFSFGPSCVQSIVPERKPWTHEFMTEGEVDEDCLSLNIWTPAKTGAERLPVFFYIYGGAFTEGSGAVPLYDGEGLAKRGLVVVTANYRLGALGFLAHPELSQEMIPNASGNYGLLDQIAVLRWIRDNISGFGGDPRNVTIAGQSAGGMSVHSLIASPLTRGLFHRAIVQSGGSSLGGGLVLPARTLTTAEAEGVKFAESLKADSIAQLRAKTWQEIIEAQSEGTGSSMFRFSPIIDGYLLPVAAREIMALGNHNDVAVLTGVNTGELGGLMGSPTAVTMESYVDRVRKQYGASSDEFLKLYPAASDQEAASAQSQSNRDQALTSLYLWARERAKTSKTAAFIYLWDHALPGPDAERFGAFHSSEIPYVLNNLSMSDRPFTDADRKIAEMMSSYWANFAATGDPNGKGLPRWDPVGEKPVVMELGDKAEQVQVAPNAERFELFRKLLTK